MNMGNLRVAVLARLEAQIARIEAMPDSGASMSFADARDWVVAALEEALESVAWTSATEIEPAAPRR